MYMCLIDKDGEYDVFLLVTQAYSDKVKWMNEMKDMKDKWKTMKERNERQWKKWKTMKDKDGVVIIACLKLLAIKCWDYDWITLK